MSNRFPLKPVVTALLIAISSSAPVLADNNIDEEVVVTPGRQITPQDEAVMSSAAVKVLRHIADARGELQGDKPDIDKAKVELDQSEKLLDIIQESLPTTNIKDRIWVAKKHLEYENSREVLPDLVPIYASLDELIDYMPTTKTKAHLDQAKQALEKGDKSKAKEQLQAMDDALLYVEADLPLSSTRHLVAQAKADLAKSDVKAANQALRAAEDNVLFISVSFQSPIAQAKAELWKASQDYALDDKESAKTDLNSAVTYLEQAARGGDKVTREAAEKLLTDVRDLHQLIETGDKGFGSKLESAWLRSKALTERSAEYISTGWQRLRAEGAGKQDLIEAKLQLAYARIDHVISKDNAAAKVDLAEAQGYLNAAAGQVDKGVKNELADVSSLMGQLDHVVQSDDAADSTAAAFDKVEARLAKLIHRL